MSEKARQELLPRSDADRRSSESQNISGQNVPSAKNNNESLEMVRVPRFSLSSLSNLNDAAAASPSMTLTFDTAVNVDETGSNRPNTQSSMSDGFDSVDNDNAAAGVATAASLNILPVRPKFNVTKIKSSDLYSVDTTEGRVFF